MHGGRVCHSQAQHLQRKDVKIEMETYSKYIYYITSALSLPTIKTALIYLLWPISIPFISVVFP